MCRYFRCDVPGVQGRVCACLCVPMSISCCGFFFVVDEVGMLISMLSVLLLGVAFVGMIDSLPAQIAMRVSMSASNRALKHVKIRQRVFSFKRLMRLEVRV